MDHKSHNIVIYCTDNAPKDFASSLSGRTGIPISENMGDDLTLYIDADGVSLRGSGLTLKGDFCDLLRRVSDGRLSHEMLVKIAKTKNPHPIAVDAAAGMGEDAFLLAAAGYSVTMFEQNAVIAALLRDALRRAKKSPQLKEIAGRMKLIEGDSIELMPALFASPDIVYLDPMFPERRKSGLINKRLQLIQKLEQPCINESEMLGAALAVHPQKIIVKRPLKGAYLAGRKPSYTVSGKAIRYDVIVP